MLLILNRRNVLIGETLFKLVNPTSPLGSGGLEWYICFQPLFFSTLRVSTLWGGVSPSPYPCTGISPPRPSWERERQRTRTFSGGGERERKRERQTETPSETMMLYLALKRSVTLNREVTSKALDWREEQEKLNIKERGREEIDQQKSTEKCSKNQPKIYENSTENRPTIIKKWT